MVKIPRFMKEYANYMKQSIINNNIIKLDIREKATINIEKAIRLTEKELITINEGMKLIMDCLK